MLGIGNQEAGFFLIVPISNLLLDHRPSFFVWKIPTENKTMDFLHSGTLSTLLISAPQASLCPERDRHPVGSGGGGCCSCCFNSTELLSRISLEKSKITLPSRRHSQEALHLQHAVLCSREASCLGPWSQRNRSFLCDLLPSPSLPQTCIMGCGCWERSCQNSVERAGWPPGAAL